MKKQDKTNAMRLLDSKGIAYKEYTHNLPAEMSGEDIAEALGQDKDRVFKTLVTVAPRSGKHYVFMVPVACELDLKKAAKACGEKSVEMVKAKELLPLTGYVHGGCSPIGMKKPFETFIHLTADGFETVFCSGGRIGLQIEISPADLKAAAGVVSADIISDR
ncbi:MAG: Cys-tRNA(Pro) deacylase [Ruminococcus sp.]|nr:Cys-tRNA(Pro) deacylase [Ruminococcus sp.]